VVGSMVRIRATNRINTKIRCFIGKSLPALRLPQVASSDWDQALLQ
jgi:hypothetical protein